MAAADVEVIVGTDGQAGRVDDLRQKGVLAAVGVDDEYAEWNLLPASPAVGHVDVSESVHHRIGDRLQIRCDGAAHVQISPGHGVIVNRDPMPGGLGDADGQRPGRGAHDGGNRSAHVDQTGRNVVRRIEFDPDDSCRKSRPRKDRSDSHGVTIPRAEGPNFELETRVPKSKIVFPFDGRLSCFNEWR